MRVSTLGYCLHCNTHGHGRQRRDRRGSDVSSNCAESTNANAAQVIQVCLALLTLLALLSPLSPLFSPLGSSSCLRIPNRLPKRNHGWVCKATTPTNSSSTRPSSLIRPRAARAGKVKWPQPSPVIN